MTRTNQKRIYEQLIGLARALEQDRRKRTKPASSIRFQLNLLCNLPCMGVVLLVRSEQEYIDGLVRAEILQEIGRLLSALAFGNAKGERRPLSHLRLDESFEQKQS